jgi:c-di-GMP-binding flagellar brake protein YcgR
LLLPFGRTERIAIVATVLRSFAIDGEREYGLRFDSLSPSDELRLQRILSILMSDPQTSGRRSEARLVQRLEIEYGDAGELRATLEDISASGLMLTVPEPLTIDQSLLISLSCADANCGLDLRGRVVHQTAIEAGDYTAYRVGLRLEHPTPELRTQVTEMLRQLASLPPSAHFANTLHADGV